MTRLLIAPLGLATALSLCAAAPVPTHLMRKSPPIAIPTKIGTTWEYEVAGKDKTLVISRSENEGDGKLVTTEWVVTETKRTPHQVVSVTNEGVFLVTELGAYYDAPWCILKLPHYEKQTWETKAIRLTGPRMAIKGTRTSRPVERVKVPAGVFQAARVDWEFAVDGGAVMTATYWYADGVGLVQRDDDMKLKSFKPGKD